MFLFSNFPSSNPILFLSLKLPCAHFYSDLSLISLLWNSSGPVVIVLSKFCLTAFNKWHWIFFFFSSYHQSLEWRTWQSFPFSFPHNQEPYYWDASAQPSRSLIFFAPLSRSPPPSPHPPGSSSALNFRVRNNYVAKLLLLLVVQFLSYVWLFTTPWTAACQASLSFTISKSMFKLMSIEPVMPSNHLILCHPLLLLTSIFPSIQVFSNESALCIRCPKYWSFILSISPSNEYSGQISFRIDWLDLLAVQGTLKSLL